MQILHHNSQGYSSGQALKKPQKQRGPAGFAPPPSPMDVLLPNLSVHFVQATGAALLSCTTSAGGLQGPSFGRLMAGKRQGVASLFKLCAELHDHEGAWPVV